MIKKGSLYILILILSFSLASAATLDIRNYGARCDGSDDGPEVQAAFNAANTGDIILVPCTASIGGGGLLLSGKQRVTVRGSNGGGFRAISPANQRIFGMGPFMFAVKSCTDCIIESLVLDSRNFVIGPFGAELNTRLIFRNNEARNSGNGVVGGAVSFVRNTQTQVIGNYVHHVKGDARPIWVGNYLVEEIDPIVFNNKIVNPKFLEPGKQYSAGTGIASHTSGGIFASNDITGVEGACIKRVPVIGDTRPFIVEGNILRDCAFSGLQLDGPTHNVKVRNNIMDNNYLQGLHGVSPQSVFTNSRIEHNTFTNNHAVSPIPTGGTGFQGGLLLFRGTDLVIEHNTFDDPRPLGTRTQDHGILLYSTGSGLRNIHIRHNTIKSTTYSGIGTGTVVSPISNLRITNNVVTNHPNYAIRLDAGSVQACHYGNTFSGNTPGNEKIGGGTSYSQCSPTIPPPQITTSSLPSGRTSQFYSTTLRATSGTAPYTWESQYGSLPPGLSISSSGRISGTPTTSGTYQAVIFAYDNANPKQSAMKKLTITITGQNTVQPPPPIIPPPTLPPPVLPPPIIPPPIQPPPVLPPPVIPPPPIQPPPVLPPPVIPPPPIQPPPVLPPPPVHSGDGVITSVTEGTFVTGGIPESFLGYRFRVGNSPLTITELGRYAAPENSRTHNLRIVRATDKVSIASVQLSMAGSTSGTFKYQPLSSPITLSSNTEYYLVSSEIIIGSGDSLYDWNTRLSSSTINILSGISQISGTWTNHGSSGNGFPLDMKTTEQVSNPPPPTLPPPTLPPPVLPPPVIPPPPIQPPPTLPPPVALPPPVLPPPIIPPPIIPPPPVQQKIITVDSTFSGYDANNIDNNIVDPEDPRKTWASSDSATPHWIELDFGQNIEINSVTIYWAYNQFQSKFMASKRVDIQYWDGNSFRTIAELNPQEEESSTSTNFQSISTSKLRFYQNANDGPSTYQTIFWITEIDYGTTDLVGDVNKDRTVDVKDMIQVVKEIRSQNPNLESDLTNDGKVDIFDLIFILRRFS